jgi:hypothetical protein
VPDRAGAEEQQVRRAVGGRNLPIYVVRICTNWANFCFFGQIFFVANQVQISCLIS